MGEAAVVVGGGLAGSEAAWQLARAGLRVTLHEMKPGRRSPAHHLDGLAELVCSNSLRSDNPENAVGLLHEELRRLGTRSPWTASASARS
jgi:methylenetetrahydrofolate--tRNA-(uracil-5-)-methyltransferase